MLLLSLLTLPFDSFTQNNPPCQYASSTQVKPQLRYQSRGNGSCEGFIQDLVSAPKLEIVSFTFGRFSYSPTQAEIISLQPPSNFKERLYIEAKGIPFELDYRMNTVIGYKEDFDWNTGTVLTQKEETRQSKKIGVVGYTKDTNGKIKVVPLRIKNKSHSNYLFIIFRSNSSLRQIKWQTNTSSTWQIKKGEFLKGEAIVIPIPYQPNISTISIKGIDGEGDEIIDDFDLKVK
jgi:hypothetical protein